MDDTFGDIGSIARSIQASSAVNVIAWLGTGLMAVVGFIWVLRGDTPEGVQARATALATLWPVVTPWVTGLAVKSGITARQKKEVVRAASFVQVKQAEAAMRPPLTMAGGGTIK